MPTASIVRKIYSLISLCHSELGNLEAALDTSIEGRKRFPDDAELTMMEGRLRHLQKDYVGAEDCFKQCIEGNEKKHFGSVATGLRSFRARNHLALVYRDQDRLQEAESQWKTALEESPDYLPAALALCEFYVKQQNWSEAEKQVERLSALGNRGEEEAVVLKGLMQLRQGNVGAARLSLSLGACQFPQSLRIKRMFADSLLREGQNLIMAERVFREIIELDPNDERARNCLRQIGVKLGRST